MALACLKPGRLRAVLVMIACFALIIPATASGLTLIRYDVTLTATNPRFDTPQFDLLTSVPQANPAGGLRDAYIYVTLASGTTWNSLTVTVNVQSGNSVTVEILDPSNFQKASGQAAGAPGIFTVQSPLVTSQPYQIHIQQLVTGGTTDFITVTVVGVPPLNTGGPLLPPPPPDYTWLIVAVAVVAAAVILAFVYVRRGGGGAEAPTTTAPPVPMQPQAPSPFGGGGETTVIQGGGGTKQYYAGFEMPNGQIVPITDINKEFGRDDFRAQLPADVQQLVSRRHFKVSFSPRDKTFLIEDLGSANGTSVNNSDIRNKGRVPLKNDDVVSLGGVINLKFKG